MRVISKRRLREFWERHADSETALRAWYGTVQKATWQNLIDVRFTYPHADSFGGDTVFNIKGNTYRLIVKINYSQQLVFIREILTHAEYDKGAWK